MKLFSLGNKGFNKNSRRFSQDLYENLDDSLGSRRSAKEVIPLVLELIQPQSVIDVGCGVGSWLAVFKEFGVQDILGVDVDYIDRKFLKIPEEKFFPFDLKKPLEIDRIFDLVICLEVAADLPSECAEMLVNYLTKLGPIVLFSSAVPFQDDSGLRINQQWPEYWVSHFRQKGYVVIDCLRKKIWNNHNVQWWFAQNMLLFVRQDYLESSELLQREFENTCTSQLSMIHPEMYLAKRVFRSVVAQLPIAAMNALRRRLAGQTQWRR